MRVKSARAVAVAASIALSGLSAVAGQDPPVRRLQPIGVAPTGVRVDVEAAPPRAFALEPTSLHVLDTRDTANVRGIAQLDIPGQHWRMALHESRFEET